MNWYDGRMASFDTETTGVDPEVDRIVQGHIVYVGGGEETVTTDLLICPGVPIAEEATAVHGITNERAQAEGTAAPYGVATLALGLQRAIRYDMPVIVYNAPFDLTLLDRECRRHGIEPPAWDQMRVVDPLVIDKWADRFRRGSRNLAATCAHYGVDLGDDAHEAGADALAAARLTWRMMRKSDLVQGRHPEIVQRRTFWKRIRDDVHTLHGAQIIWQHEQAEGLRLHFEGKGETEKAASVRVGWPLVPAPVEVES